jgi:hypothetical protein
LVIGSPEETIPGAEGFGGFCGRSAIKVPLELTGRIAILGRDCCCSRWVPGVMVVGMAIFGIVTIVTSEEVE